MTTKCLTCNPFVFSNQEKDVSRSVQCLLGSMTHDGSSGVFYLSVFKIICCRFIS